MPGQPPGLSERGRPPAGGAGGQKRPELPGSAPVHSPGHRADGVRRAGGRGSDRAGAHRRRPGAAPAAGRLDLFRGALPAAVSGRRDHHPHPVAAHPRQRLEKGALHLHLPPVYDHLRAHHHRLPVWQGGVEAHRAPGGDVGAGAEITFRQIRAMTD